MQIQFIRTLACAALGLLTPALVMGQASQANAASAAAAEDANALYDQAAALALAGDVDKAFALLERSVAAGFSDGWTLAYDTDVDKLRADPRWAQLQARFDHANPAWKYLLILRNQKLSAAERYFPVSQALASGLVPPTRMAKEFGQTFATQATFLGSYDEADRNYDQPPTKADPIGAKFLEARPAVEWIVRAAGDRKAVFLNESHGEVRTRANNIALLAPLRRLGFRYLALEGLSAVAPAQSEASACARATILDSQLSKRGYPISKTGYYADEPIYGELVREALRLGFELVAYDPYVADQSQADREQAQASNLACLFQQDPDARLVAIAGFSHISEESSSEPGSEAMALRFKAMTGVDPLTVDQTSLLRLGREALVVGPEIPASSREFVLVNAEGAAFGSDKFDLIAWAPRMDANRDGPGDSWLQLGGLRHRVRVGLAACAGAKPCTLEARPVAESDEATPIDRCVIEAAADHCTLFLTTGRHRIEGWDASRHRLASSEVSSP